MSVKFVQALIAEFGTFKNTNINIHLHLNASSNLLIQDKINLYSRTVNSELLVFKAK